MLKLLQSPELMLTVNGEISILRLFLFVLLGTSVIVALWYLFLEVTNYALWRLVDSVKQRYRELKEAERSLRAFERAIIKKRNK